MIERITGRREFETLSRHGRRARTQTLWCRYLPDSTAVPARVGFAIGRPVGGAVVRNRLRRRLRHLLTTDPQPLGHGVLLIGARPPAAERSFDQLRAELMELLLSVRSMA